MSSYVKTLYTRLKGKLGDVIANAGFSQFPLSQKIQTLRQIAAELRNTESLRDDIACMFSQVIDDIFPHLLIEEGSEEYFEIPAESGRAVYDTLLECIEYSGGSFAITSQNGYVFSFSPFRKYESLPSDEGRNTITIGITSQGESYAFPERVVWSHGGKWYISPMIRSVGYISEGDIIPYEASTLRGYLDCFLDYFTLRTTQLEPTLSDRLEALYPITGMHIADYTFYDICDRVASVVSAVSDGTLLGTCASILASMNEHLYLQANYGIRYPIVSLLSDVVESNLLNGALLSITDMVVQNKFSIELLRTMNHTETEPVRDLLSKSAAAFSAGGIEGVADMLITAYNDASIQEVDDTGVLAFTNNSGSMPQSFIAGAVMSVFSNIGQVISFVGTLINPIFSGVSWLCTSAFNAVANFIESKHDGVYASVNTPKDAALMAGFPFGLYQGQGSCPESLKDILSQNRLVEFPVPGGSIYIGGAGQSSPNDVRFEFHPAIAAAPDARKLLGWDHNPTLLVADIWPSGDATKLDTCVAAMPDVRTVNPTITLARLTKGWFEYSHPIDIDYDDRGILTSDSDSEVLYNLYRNTAIFLTWLYLLSSETPIIVCSPFSGAYCPVAVSAAGAIDSDYVDQGAFSDYLGPFILGLVMTHFEEFHLKVVAYNVTDVYRYTMSYDNFIHYATSTEVTGANISCSFFFYYLDGLILKPSGTSHAFIYGTYQIVSYILRPSEFSNSIDLPYNRAYMINVPKYRAADFWRNLILSTIITTAIAGCAIIATVKFKKWARKKRATNAVKTERAWNALVETEPMTDENVTKNYKAYRRQSRATNLWSKVIGGSKYDTSNYWGAVDDDEGSTVDQGSSGVVDFLRSLGGDDGVTSDGCDTLLYKLITGNEL